jgi:hypothetical protein
MATEWTLPPLSDTHAVGSSFEEMMNILIHACSESVNPINALRQIKGIRKWASKEMKEDAFRLLFDVDRTFGGFCLMYFKNHPVYYVPMLNKIEMMFPASKSTKYDKSVLDALLSLTQKISFGLIALDCIREERTQRPLEHMLPTDVSEKKRCESLFDIVLCVWTRMCHVWGIIREESDTFLCKELSCFSIDGQCKPPFLWFDVDAGKRRCYLKGTNFNVDTMRSVRVYTWPDKNWFTFSTETNEQIVSDVKPDSVQFLTIMFLEAERNRPDIPFKIMPGNVADYFLLITTGKGVFHSFYDVKGDSVLRYPILFHPMIGDILGPSPRTDGFVDIPLDYHNAEQDNEILVPTRKPN